MLFRVSIQPQSPFFGLPHNLRWSSGGGGCGGWENQTKSTLPTLHQSIVSPRTDICSRAERYCHFGTRTIVVMGIATQYANRERSLCKSDCRFASADSMSVMVGKADDYGVVD